MVYIDIDDDEVLGDIDTDTILFHLRERMTDEDILSQLDEENIKGYYEEIIVSKI